MITTMSRFVWCAEITRDNNKLDFGEGGPQITATIPTGFYSPTDLATEVSYQMTSVGTQSYTCAFDRANLNFSFNATSNFELKVSTGSNVATSIFLNLGFIFEKTGSNSYSPDVSSASIYTPQYKLQNYISTDDWQGAIDEKVFKTTGGDIEVITFGSESFMQCEIAFATNIAQPSGGPIENQSNGVDNLRDFMKHIIKKAPVEFIPDRNDIYHYEELRLESTESSSNGTGYKLIEEFGKGLPGYFRTGILVFRKM